MDEFEELFRGLDEPRPLPPALRTRLAQNLTPLAGLDAPHPLPPHLRARLERQLVRSSTGTRWLAVAAALVLVVGGVTVALRNRPSHTRTSVSSLAGPAAAIPSQNGTSGQAVTESGGATASGPASASEGSPSLPAARALPSAGAAVGTSASAIAITVVGGNAAEVQGFQAYISQLNQKGGRQISTAGGPKSVATVNLSDQPLVGTRGPVLETLAVADAELAGSVFDAASSPRHQAVALVDALSFRAGQVVAIYRGSSGIWAAEVPDAMATAVRAHGAAPVVMTYVPGQLTPGPATALLALDTQTASGWLAEAARRGYHPTIAGIESLAEPSLALPNGTRVLAPYLLTGVAELSAIGPHPGTAAIHGWVTAKVLAAALTRAVPPDLKDMAGYADGFAPPLAFRPGTNSRVPDGTLYTIEDHAFTGGGAFVRDPS